MNQTFQKLFPAKLRNVAYENYHEYLKSEFDKVKILLDYYLKAKESNDFSSFRLRALMDFSEATSFTDSRIKKSKENFYAGEYLKKVYKLSAIEWFAFVVALLVRVDKNHMEKFLKINSEKQLSYSAILKLYFFVDDIYDINDYYNRYISLYQKMDSLCFEEGNIKIDECLFQSIMTNVAKSVSIFGVKTRVPLEDKPLIIREEIAQKMVQFFKNAPKKEVVYFHISGVSGSGKKTIVNRMCDILKKAVVCLDLKKLTSDASKFTSVINSAYREALFNKGFICIENFSHMLNNENFKDYYVDFILDAASKFSKVVFILSNDSEEFRKYLNGCYFIEIPLETLDNQESFLLWESYLSGLNVEKGLDIHEIANKFRLTPMQIKNTVVQASHKSAWNENLPIDKFMICDSAYNQVTNELSSKATVIKKKHKWDELVMPAEQKELLRRACDQIKYKHIVYEKWGMKNRILYGRGLSMLFEGPPGTGKTMAAQVVAHELGLEIYKIDLSQVISKYIGETEKNLGEVFDSAKKSNVILLFDEMDAIFGKRTEVKDSHDKNANVETSYLLQKMEEYDGITIMTTNFIENIDKAFFRRINYVVHFSLPDVALRKEIWKKMFPKETPCAKDIDFNYLSKNFEIAGGSIKNTVLTSSFMAAAKNTKVGMKHILKALEYEMRKQGKLVSKSDFGEYSYLL